jgi:hypothetical protein
MPQEITATEQQFTAGFRLLTMADVDARKNRSARQVRAAARALSSDLGDDLPVAQRMLVQRCAVLAALCSHSEATLLNGGTVSIPDYVSMTATLSRLLRTLGLKRVPREVIPDPLTYAREYVSASEDEPA